MEKSKVERIKEYFNGTVTELKKCTWPSWEELKGSTVVVISSVLILAAFVAGSDVIMQKLIRLLTQI